MRWQEGQLIPTRPVLRYFGGKWRIAPWIIENMPTHRIYCEPFGGGASVLLQKPVAFGEVYNDLDGEVVNVFRVIQRHPKRFERLMRATPYARDELEIAYRQVRDPVERARRAIIRSFMGFGADSVTRDRRTGFRTNSNQGGTTPAHDWANWPDQIQVFANRLRKVVLENRDATEVMESQDSEKTLHYVDPPYPIGSRSDRRHGYRFELTDADHEKLVACLAGLKGMVMVSGYSHPIYKSLGWDCATLEARTFGPQNASRPREERIWRNAAAVAGMSQMRIPGV